MKRATPVAEAVSSAETPDDMAPFPLVIDTPLSPLPSLDLFDEQLWMQQQDPFSDDLLLISSAGRMDQLLEQIDAVPSARQRNAVSPNAGVGDVTTRDRKAARAERAAKRQTDYRSLKKTELLDLRAMSGVLAARRDELIAKRRVTAHKLHQLSCAYGYSPGWRGVAMRQIQRRIEAETLNHELRAQVYAHQTLIQHMSSAMRLQTASLDSQRAVKLTGDSISTRIQVSVNDVDVRMLATILGEMEALYAETGDVFRGVENFWDWEKRDTPWYSCKWRSDPGNEFASCIETKTFPFKLLDTIQAALVALPTVFGASSSQVELPMSDPTNTIAVKFQIEYSNAALLGAYSSQFESVSVIRVFHEAERVVVLWRAIFTNCNTRQQFVATSWTVASEKDFGGSFGTTLRSYCTTRPIRVPNNSANASLEGLLDEFSGMIALFVENDALKLATAVENILLDKHALIPSQSSTNPLWGEILASWKLETFA